MNLLCYFYRKFTMYQYDIIVRTGQVIQFFFYVKFTSLIIIIAVVIMS